MIKNASESPRERPSRLLSTEEAAHYLDLRVNTLEVWRTVGRYRLPYVKIGRNVRYRQRDLDAFLDRNTVDAENASP